MSTEPDAPSVVPENVPARRRNHALMAVVIAVLVVAADQLSKWWAMSSLELGAPQRNVLGDFLSFRLVMNPYAALGLGAGYTWVITVVVVVVVAVIIRFIGRIRSVWWAVTLGMLLGGAVGNLADRLFREPGFARGHVVDFIGYAHWFTGNVADIAIVAAAILLALLSVIGLGLDGTREEHGKAAEPDAPADTTSRDA
ncbi:MAG: signal peptidase II [Promicromonosporaceae bacterium]|nr:signal peptidase II [Promicromonosporaceae bacterium]